MRRGTEILVFVKHGSPPRAQRFSDIRSEVCDFSFIPEQKPYLLVGICVFTVFLFS